MGAGDDARWLDGAHADVYALSDDGERRRAIGLIGAPGELVKAAQLEAIPLWARWADQITSTLRASDDHTQALAHLSEWQRGAAQDTEIAASIYRTNLLADMGGQLFVREVEVPDATRALDRASGDGDVPPFLRMQFREAIEAFLARQVVSPAEFAQLSDEQRMRAFTATRLASEALIERARSLLLDTLQRGGTFDDFRAALNVDDFGITPASSAYLETVYRTNVGLAYGAGRLRQIQSPAVRAARPYVQYRTAGDNRVRQSHAELDGVVFRQDDPEWPRFMPPNGFACRCTCVTLRESQVDRSKLRNAAEMPAAAQPDQGFDAPPATPRTTESVPRATEPTRTRAPTAEPLLNGVVARPTRPLTPFRTMFQGLTPEQATEVAVGERPTANGEPWLPITIVDERAFVSSDGVRGGVVIRDGNHRLTAAAEAGATEILAQVKTYDARGDLVSDETRRVPISGLGIEKIARAEGT